MEVFELKCGNLNDFSPLVISNDEDALTGLFRPDGKSKLWETRPTIRAFIEKGRKKQKLA